MGVDFRHRRFRRPAKPPRPELVARIEAGELRASVWRIRAEYLLTGFGLRSARVPAALVDALHEAMSTNDPEALLVAWGLVLDLGLVDPPAPR